MKALTMRDLLLSISTMIGIYVVVMFVMFGTLSPCGAFSVQVRRINYQAMEELQIPRGLAQQSNQQAQGFINTLTPLQCVSGLWEIYSDRQGAAEKAKDSWKRTRP